MIDFYCIYKKDDNRSELLLEECINSGRQVDINVIPFPGIYENIERLMKEKDLMPSPFGVKKLQSIGVFGCFLSHYLLWEKCVELNAPIGVLEYDAIFLKKLPEDILSSVDYYCNLDYNRHLYLNTDEAEYISKATQHGSIEIKKLEEQKLKSLAKHNTKYINRNHIRGAFGYIIKPKGANALINAAKQFGILPADVHPNLLYLKEINYTSESVVMLNPTSIPGRSKTSHTNRE